MSSSLEQDGVTQAVLKLGTRGSTLALTQSRWVASRLEEVCPNLKVELIVIKTQGDKDRSSPLSSFGGKGVFTKEIESSLLQGEIDFGVHSLKDLPTELPPGLTLTAYPQREDPRDAIIASIPPSKLPASSIIGTGSLRRRCQLEELNPEWKFDDIRGNVTTRIRKWREGRYDGIVLAMAGLKRLGLTSLNLADSEVHPLSFSQCLPAPGQGILGLECRQDDQSTQNFLRQLNHPPTALQAAAERAFLKSLQGGCNVPAGALATYIDKNLHIKAVLADKSNKLHRISLVAPPDEAETLGKLAAQKLLQAAGGEL